MSEKKQDNRKRNWTFLLYPSSMDHNYRDILNQLHIQWAESPVHDQDIRADGTHKEDHIHILLCFEGKQSYDRICEIVNSVKGVISPFPCGKNGETPYVNSVRGMIRYFVHRDDPDKAQYDQSAIIGHGGIEIDEHFQYPSQMIKRFIQEMMAFCNAQSIYEYSDLLDYAAEEKYDTWYDLLTVGRQSFVMIKYLDSRRNQAKLRNEY